MKSIKMRSMNGRLLAIALSFFASLGCSESTDGSPGGGGVLGTGGAAVGTGGAAVGTGGAAVGTGGAAVGTGGAVGAGGMATGGAVGAGGTSTGGGSGGTQATGEFTVDFGLASDEGSHLTTVGIVTWSVAGAQVTDAHIEFGVDSSYGMDAPVDLTEEGFRTLLLGMKGNTTYHFRIVANDGSLVSGDYELTTGAVPNNVASYSFNAQAGSEPGFITLGSWQGSSTAFILDADGDIVWWYDSPAANVARARMSADGKNMWIVAATNMGNPLYRVTMDGLDTQTYNGISADHDLTPVSGELMAFMDYSGTCDKIFEITPAGNPTLVFDSTGIVSGQCHGNSVRYSQAEDVYIFSEHMQDILVVDRSGGLEWRLSELVSGGNGSWGGQNHGTHLLDDTLLVFANVGGGQGSSTVIEYSRSDWSVVDTFNTGNFTANMGDVQRLPGGNTLITYSNAGEVREVDGSGNVVLSIDRQGGPNFSYTMWRASLYGEPPDIGM